MNSNLDKLLSDEDFQYLVEDFDSENLELLKQKGAYPYEYMISFEKFHEERLPARKHFFSSIKKEKNDEDGKISDGHISVKDYLTCKKIWDKFKMKNMGDYHDHYFKKNVFLLADVLEKFMDTCLKYYGLDPCHCFSSPGLSWVAMLKITGIKLEKISDIDKQLVVEKGLRGGISNIAKRYAKANSKYPKNYDSKKPSSFITYLDMNNLYGWAMSKYLLYGQFEWLKNVDGFDVNSISENSSIGYFFEVDLEYPAELHKLHNDYQLAPEKLALSNDMLLGHCRKIVDKYQIKVGDVKKLIPNLGNKKNYVIYCRNLQLYLSLRMKLTKIHRVIKFKQSDWMKKYIDFNTKKE